MLQKVSQVTAPHIDFESVVIKTEKISISKEDAMPNNITKSGTAENKNKRVKEASLSPSKSEKSIYEDAVTEEKSVDVETHSNENGIINETYNTPADSTFTAPLTDSTFTLPNETFNCVRDAKISDKSKNDESCRESIMTEDNSIEEKVQSQNMPTSSLKSTIPITAKLVPSKKKKEIFK